MDSADQATIDTAAHELHALLDKPSLVGIPLLVLGNKNDLPSALSEEEITERMQLKVSLLWGTIAI